MKYEYSISQPSQVDYVLEFESDDLLDANAAYELGNSLVNDGEADWEQGDDLGSDEEYSVQRTDLKTKESVEVE